MDNTLTIVTGASQNHARALLNLLFSLDRFEPATPVVVYDLGLAPYTLDVLRRQRRTIVPFRFADYPPHVGGNQLKTYAWKPAMVHEVLRARGLPLLYLDAGDLVLARLDRVRAEIARIGIYCPYSRGTIEDWTHPLMLEAFQVEPELLGARNRNAAIVGLGDSVLARELAVAWYEASMKPEIICPPGATRLNHRFDQAILTVLMERAQRRHGFDFRNELLDIATHNDWMSLGHVCDYLRTGIAPDRPPRPKTASVQALEGQARTAAT